MQRRTFIKCAAAAGLSVTVPALGPFPRRARADRYEGPYWLFVNAQGGWDPRFLFDPTLNGAQNRIYTTTAQVGAITAADLAVDVARVNLAVDQGIETHLLSPADFLGRHGARLLVLNGIDTATNNHDAGQRTMSSGQLSAGYPALAALIAAERGPDQPMAFLSGGGYDATSGLIPLSRVTSPDSLARVARPNEISPGQSNTELYHSAGTLERIAARRQERIVAQRERQRLPALGRAIDALRAARGTTAELAQLVVTDTLVDLPAGLDDLERFERQVQLAYAAFGAGLSICASVTLSGFDTHGNHDRDQSRQLWKLLGGIDFALQHAGQKGLGGNLFVIVTSDFARGPEYNGSGDGGGKDHWPITSMLAIGPGIEGNRVIGATTDDQRPRAISASTLMPEDGGITLTPQLIHRALRKLAGVEGSPFSGKYPLLGMDLPLFG